MTIAGERATKTARRGRVRASQQCRRDVQRVQRIAEFSRGRKILVFFGDSNWLYAVRWRKAFDDCIDEFLWR